MNGEYIKQNEYITIYNYDTAQNEFENNNGICILQPSVCEITEELNGEYSLYLEHPFDEEGRWKSLVEQNIIKADGQLFRILEKDTSMGRNGEKVRTVNAVHIFYDLGDKLIEKMEVDGWSPYWFLANMFKDYIYNDDPQKQYHDYSFSFSTDFNPNGPPFGWGNYINSNPVKAILGADDCFVNIYKAEIHRDNFRFSLNQRKEGTSKNAFNIEYGSNMMDIKEKIDYRNLCTNIIVRTNLGSMWGSSYVSGRFAHHITKEVLFNYNPDEYSEEKFWQDAENYFNAIKNPLATYDITYANLQNADLYKDFIKLKELNVGDEGRIYNPEIDVDIDDIKIVSKVKDVLHNDTVSMRLGNKRANLSAREFMSNTISVNPMSSGIYAELI